MIKYPSNIKYCRFPSNALNKNAGLNNGIIIVSHESNRMGASILAGHLQQNMKKEPVFLVARQFGELNDEYSANGQIVVASSVLKVRIVLRKLKKTGYRKIILNTVINSDIAKTAKELGFRTVFLIHETMGFVNKIGFKSKIPLIFQYSDVVVFPNKVVADQYKEFTGDKKTIIRPQGRYLKIFNPDEILDQYKSVRKKIRNQKTEKIVIGVGNTNSVKGFDLFVKMAKRFDDRVRFVWAGRCQKEFFNKAIKESPSNFQYYGQISDEKEMGAFYENANLLFLSSRYDTFPSAMIEAASYGVPTIGFSQSGGIMEFVRDNENGFVIEGGYSQKQGEAIIRKALTMNSIIEVSNNAKASAAMYNFEEYVGFLEKL